MNVEEGADYEQTEKHDSKNEGITRKCKHKTRQNKTKRTTNNTSTSEQDKIASSADPLIMVDGPATQNSKARRCCLPRSGGSSAAVAGDIQSLTALGGTVQTVATVIWQNTIIKGPQMQVLGFRGLGGPEITTRGFWRCPNQWLTKR
ncbi:hypothetical protein QR685DRAFT_592140 [Neurospora intermedia]|uniref:Uncharacterized protein n=1 Tax=Neurospora intermedia TaxID=5142 RepID=A0ABR3D4G9_NEUIN